MFILGGASKIFELYVLWEKIISGTISLFTVEMTIRRFGEDCNKLGFGSIFDSGEEMVSVFYRTSSLPIIYWGQQRWSLAWGRLIQKTRTKIYTFQEKGSRCDAPAWMQVEHFRNNHEVLLRLLVELVLILQSNLSRTQLVRQPCALEMVKITLGQESEKKLKDISPSNDIAQSVRDLAEDIKQQVISEAKYAQFGLFVIQIHQTTDASACSQFVVFCRWFTDRHKRKVLVLFQIRNEYKSCRCNRKDRGFYSWRPQTGKSLWCVHWWFTFNVRNKKYFTNISLKSFAWYPFCALRHTQTSSCVKNYSRKSKDVLKVIKTVNYVKLRALSTRIWSAECTFFNVSKNSENGWLCSAASFSLNCACE